MSTMTMLICSTGFMLALGKIIVKHTHMLPLAYNCKCIKNRLKFAVTVSRHEREFDL